MVIMNITKNDIKNYNNFGWIVFRNVFNKKKLKALSLKFFPFEKNS